MLVRDFERLSDLLKALRRRRRLSQRALARRLGVSSGYVGQWELGMSQPSSEVVEKLCALFELGDVEYVQRLAWAARAPEWLKESILRYRRGAEAHLSPDERRLLALVKRCPPEELPRLLAKLEGWLEALVELGR